MIEGLPASNHCDGDGAGRERGGGHLACLRNVRLGRRNDFAWDARPGRASPELVKPLATMGG
jgi:hypothetical protein